MGTGQFLVRYKEYTCMWIYLLHAYCVCVCVSLILGPACVHLITR